MRTTLHILVCLIATATAPHARAQIELEDILRQADKRRQEYVESFRDLTAVETRVTEIFDENGRIEKRRTIVSDFLVYPSQFRKDVVSEYRIVREVDGKLVRNPAQNAIDLLRKLAKTRTLEQESARLMEQNVKHLLGYAAWGMTLQPFGRVRESDRAKFTFRLVSGERFNGRDVMVVGYELKELQRPETVYSVIGKGRLFPRFRSPRIGIRGFASLDPEDSRIWRVEEETLIVDDDIRTPVVVSGQVIEYGSSALGLPLPARVETFIYDKVIRHDKKTRRVERVGVRLMARIVNKYADFKRFDVATAADIKPPRLD
jgi:hypothetical protein